MINNYAQFINESLSEHVYHFTSLTNLSHILDENSINLSSTLANNADARNNKGLYFLSLSRTKSPNMGYGSTISGDGENSFVRIRLNGHKLNHNFKSTPVDYWNRKDTKYLDMRGKKGFLRDFEYEERIFTNKISIDNFNNYIVDIVVFDPEHSHFPELKHILEKCNELNISIKIFDNINNLNKNTNDINNTVLNSDDEKIIPSSNNRIDYDFLKKAIALILLPFSYDEIKTDIMSNKIETLAGENDFIITDEFIYNTKYQMSLLYHGSVHIQDFNTSLMTDIHNNSKQGYKNKSNRKIIHMVSSYLVKNKYSDIKSSINTKVYGIKTKPTSNEYTTKYSFYNTRFDELLSNSEDKNELSLYRLNGIMIKDKYQEIYNLRTVGDFINWLMNNFEIEKIHYFLSVLEDENYKLILNKNIKIEIYRYTHSSEVRNNRNVFDDDILYDISKNIDDFIYDYKVDASTQDKLKAYISELDENSTKSYMTFYKDLCKFMDNKLTLTFMKYIGIDVKQTIKP